MIKYKQGSIESLDGEVADIIVKAPAPNKLKDIVIGGCITIAGICYLTYTAFRNGAKQMEIAEFKAMESLNLFGNEADLTDQS